MENNLLKNNEKLVKEFGASPISTLKDTPELYTFKKGLIYSFTTQGFIAKLKYGMF